MFAFPAKPSMTVFMMASTRTYTGLIILFATTRIASGTEREEYPYPRPPLTKDAARDNSAKKIKSSRLIIIRSFWKTLSVICVIIYNYRCKGNAGNTCSLRVTRKNYGQVALYFDYRDTFFHPRPITQ